MKQLCCICITSVLAVYYAAAQTAPDYPLAPSAAGNITRIEYFISSLGAAAPNFGGGNALAIGAQQNISNYTEAIILGALPQGNYRVTVRSLDANGRWSLTSTGPTFDYVIAPVYPTAPAANTNIVRLEYVIDAVVPFGNGTAIPITPSTNIASLNAVIDISALPVGPHILYIRSLEATGKWSTTSIRSFSNGTAPNYPNAPASGGNIQQLEYFIDTDPGFGLATPVAYTATTDVTVSFDVNGLTAGNHTLYIRSRQNPWGLVTAQTFAVNGALPVTWLYVQGQLQNNSALIKWATASQINTDKFEIEHSSDGINFSSIGAVGAAGNSTLTQRYEFLHNAPVVGKNFYRIKQIDLDGKFSYSSIIVLQQPGVYTKLVISPNPTQNEATLYFKDDAAKTLQLLSINGKLLQSEQINAGSTMHKIYLDKFSPGVYLLRLQTTKGITTHKILKQ